MKKNSLFIFIIMVLLCSCEKKHYNEWVEINGNKYYYDKQGEMVKNKTLIINGEHYYFLDTGKMATGLVQDGYKMRYYDDSGRLATNCIIKYNGDNRLVDIDGNIVKNGWHNIKGNWYYVIDYDLTTGWLKNNGAWYYFGKQTYSMCVDQWINNDYYVGADGKMLVNTTKEIGGKTYIFDPSGKKTELKMPPGQVPIKIQNYGCELIIEKYPNPLWAYDGQVRINNFNVKIMDVYSTRATLEIDIDVTPLRLEYRNTNYLKIYYRIYDEEGYEIEDSFFTLDDDVRSLQTIKRKLKETVKADKNKTFKMVIYSNKTPF